MCMCIHEFMIISDGVVNMKNQTIRDHPTMYT